MSAEPHFSVKKNERIHLRLSSDQKFMIEEAAKLRHLSLSDFVLQVVAEKAEEVLGLQPMRLPVELWDHIDEQIRERPAREIPAIRKIFESDV